MLSILGGGGGDLKNVDLSTNKFVECRKSLEKSCRMQICLFFVDVDLGPNKVVECRKIMRKTCRMQSRHFEVIADFDFIIFIVGCRNQQKNTGKNVDFC